MFDFLERFGLGNMLLAGGTLDLVALLDFLGRFRLGNILLAGRDLGEPAYSNRFTAVTRNPINCAPAYIIRNWLDFS